MSSPAKPKRRRLGDDSTVSAGVSFVAQDVSENVQSKAKEKATAGDAAGDDLHAKLKASLERQKVASNAVKEVEDGISNSSNELYDRLATEREELEAKYSAARRDLEAKHVAARAEHLRVWIPKRHQAYSAMEKTNEEVLRVRDLYRKKGGIEFDSLLFVGNDGIMAVLRFLTAREVGRSQFICRTFRDLLSQNSSLWESVDHSMHNRSTASEDARANVVRHHVVSKFVERLESLLEKHSTGHFNRCRACSEFPSKLLIDPSPAKYELFVRFSRQTMFGRILLLEGFVDYRLYNPSKPFSGYCTSKLTFNLDTLDLSSWPSMERVFSLNGGRNDNRWRLCAEDALDELTLTVVAVERSTSKAYLVVGSADFDHEAEDDNGKTYFYGKDDMTEYPHKRWYLDGDYSYCLAFKWDDERNAERKFECHVIAT